MWPDVLRVPRFEEKGSSDVSPRAGRAPHSSESLLACGTLV